MKMFHLVFMVIGSFATGFLLADGLAKSAPELVFVPAAATTQRLTEQCETTVEFASTRAGKKPAPANLTGNSAPHSSVSRLDNSADLMMPLEKYSALVASQQRSATELILQLEDADIVQMIEQQQQDQQFNAQSDSYQQLLNEFMTTYPEVVQPQLLTCSSRFCLLELDIHNFSAWPALFNTLTAQHWWQSISYQSAAEHAANNTLQTGRITLLLQHDWDPASGSQQLAVADGSQFD